MGEANIRFARGEREEAILMCMEIIRQGFNVGIIDNSMLIVWLLKQREEYFTLLFGKYIQELGGDCNNSDITTH